MPKYATSTLALLTSSIVMVQPLHAQQRSYSIPAGRLLTVLEAFTRQTDLQIVYDSGQVDSVRSPGVQGAMSADQALRVLLTGTGFSAERDPSGAIAIVRTRVAAMRVPARAAPAPASQDEADAPAPAAPIEAPADDIVVTALRRASTLQTTPASIAAIKGEELARLGATGLQDYFRQVPNLNLTQGVGGQFRTTIRGINAAGEATVGLYFDEVPITGPNGTTQDAGANAADLNLFDIERVEVLRGPQGTLYGSSSMAGTLRIIFNKPDATRTQGAAEAQLSSVDGGSTGWFVKAMINQPIVEDVLAVRLSGYVEQRPGAIDNVRFGTRNVNDSSSKGIRALVALTPQPDMTLTGTVIYQKTEADDQQGWLPAIGRNRTDSPLRLPFDSKLQLYNLVYDWDLPGVTLTATGSYYRYDILRSLDFSAPVAALSASPAGCRTYFALSAACSTQQLADYRSYGVGQLPVIGYQPANLRAKTAEVRASSTGRAPFQWTVGAFYEHREDHIDSIFANADLATGDVYLPLRRLSARFIDTRLRQTAFFGEFSYKPVDALTLTVGARHYDYRKTTGGQVTLASPLTGTVLSPFSEVTAKASGWIRKVNISYQATPHLLVYALASEGFRPGGANNVPSLESALVSYTPDKLWNYEAGIKSSWLDNALTLNLTAFQIDWSDIQTRGTVANGLFAIIANAGKARVRGGEIEIVARPLTGLTLNASAGYSDAKLTSDQVTVDLLPTGSTGLAGDRLPNVPDFSASASASYSWPLFGDYNGLVRADYAYTGSIHSAFRRETDPYFEVYGKYSTIGLRLGIEKADRGVYLFVNNLTDSTGRATVTSGFGYEQLTYSIQPRTFGINARAAF